MSYTYSDRNLLASVDNLGTPGVPNLKLDYTYGQTGFRQHLIDSLGGEFEWDFASDGRLQAVVWGENVIAFGFDQNSRVKQIDRRTGPSTHDVSTALTYDAADRLTGITHSYDTTQLSAFTYSYTPRGDLTGYSGPEGSVNYSYDDTRQLTGASGARTEAYSYDANGNRTLGGYVIGTNNRLLSDGAFNYTYDDEGNRLTKTEIATGEVHEYTWDHRNRLTKVVIRSSAAGPIIREARFTYDVDNNLIIRWTDADGDGPLAADQLFTVYDGLHAYADFNAAGQLTDRYLHGGAVDQLLARLDAAGNVDFYLTDNLGSVRQIVDPAGAILNATNYDSFGNILTETNPALGDRFKFTAREWEAAIDLQFSRARWYDPFAGRFISDDPEEFTAGELNLTRYVSNTPTGFVDPLGLAFVPANPHGRNGLEPVFIVRGGAECGSLSRRIENVRMRIKQRTSEHRENPLGLPESAPGDDQHPSRSRRGHRRLINEDNALLAKLLAEYAYKCGACPELKFAPVEAPRPIPLPFPVFPGRIPVPVF